MKKRPERKVLWQKAIACMIGIIVLFFIASTYRNYVVREGKAPYLTMQEFSVQAEVLQKAFGHSGYEELIAAEKKEYVTVGTVKKILNDFPNVDQSVLKEYKKDSWYIGIKDWNGILLDIAKHGGNADFYTANLMLIGNEANISDTEGKVLEKNQILTNRGIMQALYWNTEAYLYSNVTTVCYQNEILSIVGYSDISDTLSNVYVVAVSESEVHFYTNHYHMKYEPTKPFVQEEPADGENATEEPQKLVIEKNGKELTAGTIVDLQFEKGSIFVDAKETEFVHGKLLQVSDSGIEIEGYGIFEPTEDMKVYRLYSELSSMDKKDLRIGYSFTDFVLEDGKVVACLMIKEEDMEYIRVLLKDSDLTGRYHDTFQAYCNQDSEVIYYENGIEKERISIPAMQSILVRAEDLNAGRDRMKLLPKVLSAKTTVESIERSQGTPSYLGTIEITASQDGLLLVNEVLLEDYLCKVVPSEMPSSYPKEALMAQAICARTYAYGKMIKTGLPDFGAHVDDSAGFQVYNNINEQSTTTEAVKATHNMVAQYEGEPIGTYYYSTSCGVGTDVSIWHGSGENPPYLKALEIGDMKGIFQETESENKAGLEDQGNTTTLLAERLTDEEYFREWIQSKEDSHFEAEEGWYRWTYTAEQLDLEYMLSVLQKRYENNPNMILTQKKGGEFESMPITEIGELLDIRVTKRLPGGVADELYIIGSEATIKIISELNIRYVLADGKTKVLRQSGDYVNASSSIPSAYMIIDLEREGETVTGYKITGGGFGHGVGMSQNGAKNMAQMGMTCEEILSFFYPGMELKTLQFGE